MKKGKYNVLMGAQAGSEAKGKMSAFLANKFPIDILTMTACPNAGHTVILDGRKLVTYHLPAAIGGSPSPQTVVLGPASVINPSILIDELLALTKFGRRLKLIIDPRATIITPSMIKDEGFLTKIGSTGQGVGMARIARIKRIGVTRMADVWEEIANLSDLHHELILAEASPGIHSALTAGATVLHESTQGFDLCLDHGIDPMYCTTRNITTSGALAEFGIPPSLVGDVYGVLRPFPIRVNNRDGSSGPYAEAREINWDMVRVVSKAPHDLTEKTTTTKLTRRVFEFCHSRFLKYLQVCDPDYLCLQFANYLDYDIYGKTRLSDIPGEVEDFIDLLDSGGRAMTAYVGTGPDHREMIDLGVDRG